MQNILIFVILASLFQSCADTPAENSVTLNGLVKGVSDNTEGYLVQIEDNQFKVVDTLLVTEESFNLSRRFEELPDVYFLKFKGMRGQVPFVVTDNSETIQFKIHKDSLFTSKIDGGADNEILKTFTDYNYSINLKKDAINQRFNNALLSNDSTAIKVLKKEYDAIVDESNLHFSNFITRHSKSIVAIIAIENMLVTNSQPASRLQAYFNSLPQYLQESRIGKTLGQTINARVKTEIGAIAPDFEGKTPEGNTFKLNTLNSKVTIVDFWAAWCGPCRRENPNLVAIYKKYKDKGLNIVGVSLDGHPNQSDPKAEWVKAIRADNLDWIHVSDLEYFNGSIPKKYNINSIPATFVLDENRKIIAKDLRGDKLDAKIAEILN